ncbi:M4 family metallopeptidase, partial [Flavobacterium sp. UBA6031]|uniref:M4 family metallopeptidase n=1 Tax=Flavobacterium sp. UBA6031 TaxID=1946551 RepID=UPI0025C247BB
NEFSRTIKVVAKQDGCITASVTTAFNGNKTINTDYSNTYRLNDICQTSAIHIRDYNSTTELTNPLEITSSTNTWTTTTQRFGGSVLWAVKQAYNYFLNVHSRKSYDNTNGSIDGYVNAYFSNSKTYSTDNASMSWTGGHLLVGLGSSGTLSNCFGTLDIIAHEYTHAVTASTAGLEYQYDSGALNESFSDIFGEIIEYSVLGINDWLMGADRSSVPLRSMSNPKDYHQPDTYLSTNNDGPWYTGTGDNGGVHTNSGVQNFWFYLLVEGGSGTNDNGYAYFVTGISMDKAAKIAYKTLTGGYLTSTSDYPDACQGSINAAEDLYGIGSTEANAVTNAWCAVGIGSCNKPKTPVITLNGSKLHSDAPTGNQWYNQNGQINGETNQNYTFTKSGNYYVVVSISGVSSVASNIININITDIPETDNSKTFKVYPNPVSGVLNIEVSELNEKNKFEILNLTGQVIYCGKLITKTIVQTSSFPAGVYFLKLENGSTIESRKIVIE